MSAKMTVGAMNVYLCPIPPPKLTYTMVYRLEVELR